MAYLAFILIIVAQGFPKIIKGNKVRALVVTPGVPDPEGGQPNVGLTEGCDLNNAKCETPENPSHVYIYIYIYTYIYI